MMITLTPTKNINKNAPKHKQRNQHDDNDNDDNGSTKSCVAGVTALMRHCHTSVAQINRIDTRNGFFNSMLLRVQVGCFESNLPYVIVISTSS